MKRKLALFSIVVLLGLFDDAHAQPWSGILDPSRAINWQRATVGVSGGIPTSYTQCATVSPGASAALINSTIAGCPNNTYVLLSAGTYNLSASIQIHRSNVILRGAGPTQTQLFFSAAGAGGSFSGTLYIAPNALLGAADCGASGTYATCPGRSNAANWTAGYTQGTTSITLANVGSAGISNGNMIVLDQANEVTDNGGYMSCDNGGAGLSPEQGVSFNCMAVDGQPAGNTGRVINGVPWAQQQFVTVVSGCASACSGAGPFNLTISPGLYENNWNQGNAAGKTGAWFVNTISRVGVENLSIDNSGCPNDVSCQSGISFIAVDQGWVKNVRIIHTRRNHVWFVNASRMELRDSYMFAANNAASQSYGIECFVCVDSLIENNIVQQTAGPYVVAGETGNVFGYNFSIDNVQWPPAWQQSDLTLHSDGTDLTLYEGNQGVSFIADQLHGAPGKITAFRNWLSGRGYNTCTSGGSGTCSDFNNTNNLTSNQTYPIDLNSYARGMNLIGNVLGTPGYHTTANGGVYSNFPSTNGSGNEGVSTNRCNHSIYNFGWGQGLCANLTSVNVLNDPKVKSTSVRWGNWDAITGGVTWSTTEAQPAAATHLAANILANPGNHSLPASFYLPSRPSWWTVSSGAQPPYPAIGPDVTGGPGPGGFAYANPAANCYYNVMKGPIDGSGNPLAFDAANCYGAGSGSPAPPSPTNLTNAVQ
jgi:hypothetical protein